MCRYQFRKRIDEFAFKIAENVQQKHFVTVVCIPVSLFVLYTQITIPKVQISLALFDAKRRTGMRETKYFTSSVCMGR